MKLPLLGQGIVAVLSRLPSRLKRFWSSSSLGESVAMRWWSGFKHTPAAIDIFQTLQEASKILIVPNDRVGGLFFGAPSYKIVRQFYPQAQIKMLVETGKVSLARQLPFADDFLATRLDQPIWHPEFQELRKNLVDERFDLLFCLGRDCSFRLAYLCQHSQARLRVGFKRPGMHPFNLEVTPRDPHSYEGEQCLKMLEMLGIRGNEEVRWALTPQHARQIQARYLSDSGPPRQTIAVDWNHGEGGRLSTRQLDELVGRLVERDSRVLLFFPLADHKRARGIKDNHGNRIILVAQDELAKVAPLLEGSQALISGNTELLHLGIALQIPVVGIFAENPRRWIAPGTKFCRIVQVHSLQLLNISQVIMALGEVMKNTSKSAICLQHHTA